MSLKNFTRRSFFRFVATALATVACVGLLAGCGSDSNKPTRKGDGYLENLQVKVTVNQDDDNELKFNVNIDDKRDNTIWVENSSFWFTVDDGDLVHHYSCNKLTFSDFDSDDSDKDYTSLDASNFRVTMEKGDNFSFDITIADGLVSEGDEVILYFAPDSTYKEMYSGWIYEF